ncbi:MAG: TatD family hydrolase [Candidatus Baltobacteraceae bacterium]
MIETHCHIHDRQYDEDRDEVIARARAAGITTMVTIGEDLADSRKALAVAERYDLRAAAGIHPHQAQHAPADVATELLAFLEDPRIVAIGETGLDYYYDNSPRDAQAAVMRAQVRVARERAVPVIFHQRDAFDDFVTILREEWRPGMRGVVHCFTGTADQARTYVDEFGLLLGIGGVVTFANAGVLREAVRAIGSGAIVLETDCPYLAPVPVRGKRNEPAFLQHVAAKLGDLFGRPAGEIEAITTANARRLFDLEG